MCLTAVVFTQSQLNNQMAVACPSVNTNPPIVTHTLSIDVTQYKIISESVCARGVCALLMSVFGGFTAGQAITHRYNRESMNHSQLSCLPEVQRSYLTTQFSARFVTPLIEILPTSFTQTQTDTLAHQHKARLDNQSLVYVEINCRSQRGQSLTHNQTHTSYSSNLRAARVCVFV